MRLFYTFTFVSLLTACGGGSDSPSSISNVTDTIAPVTTLKGNNEITVEFGEVYTDEGATAIDNVDGNVTVAVIGEVDTSSVGSYNLTFTAIDTSGNSSSVIRTINVVDTIAPITTLTGNTEVTVEFEDIYADEGATAIDNLDGNVLVAVVGEVDTSSIGSYNLTFTATDDSGNSSSVIRTINVVDTIAPVTTLIGDSEVIVEFGEVYVDPGATALDSVDGALSVVSDQVVDTSINGVYELVYTATDNSGNSSSVKRTVTVLEKLTTIAGKVIDGYVSGATVWLDYNGDGNFDLQTEQSTISGEHGDYSFDFTDEQKQCLPYSTMYVDVPVGAMDADTGEVTEAYQMALPPSIDMLPDDELRHISPLTSTIWGLLQSQLKDSGKDIFSCTDLIDNIALREEVKSAIEEVILNAVTQFNLSEEQIFDDFISNNNSDAYNAAQEIVKGLKAAYKHTLDLHEQYPDAVEIHVVVYQSMENDERYNLASAWYRDVTVYLDDRTIVENVKLQDADVLNQVDYILTKLERVDSPWSDQAYKGLLSIRNDIYVNDDLTYRCGLIENITLEKDGITYQVNNSIPTQNFPTVELCSIDASTPPYVRSFKVSYSVDDSHYFGSFFFHDDKDDFNSLSDWVNVVDKADELNFSDVFTYMDALPYAFESTVEVDASFWRKRKIAGNVQIDTDNDNEWVRITKFEDNTRIIDCSDDGLNWYSCSL